MNSRNAGLALAALLATAGFLVPVANATAAAPAPGWMIDSVSLPTNLTPGDSSGNEHFLVTATNVGGATSTAGSVVTVTDTLPTGMTPSATAPTATDTAKNTITCAAAGQVVTCTDPDTTAIASGGTVQVTVPVDVATGVPSSVTNQVSVSGGGAASGASATQPTTVSSSPAAFSAHSFDGSITNADGSTDTQAGSHPFAITTSFMLSSELDSTGQAVPVANLKDVGVNLPPGVIGNPLATPRCTQAEFQSLACPAASRVGTITLLGAFGGIQLTEAVYNMVPPAGMPAQFAFNAIANVFLDASVRTGSDYGLTITAQNIPQSLAVMGEQLTFWGVPADENGGGGAPEPFLTLPATCDGPQTETLNVDSWQTPGAFTSTSFASHDSQGNPVGDTGCSQLSFAPTLNVQPTTPVADSPSGVVADLQVPQNNDPSGLATPELKDATVTLPAGLSLSPASADGLDGCTAGEIALGSAAPANCPPASQIGTASITSPLLADPLTGRIFLGTPGCSPCTNTDAADGNMVHGYIQAQADGVLIKLPGTFTLNTTTGQITAQFLNTPQLPFSDLRLDFNGGSRGVLATPEACGTYTSTGDLVPWSSPFAPNASAQDSFTISGCGNPSQFSPSFTAGVINTEAGAYSPFVLSFSRADTDQEFQGLSATLPPGMLANLSAVPLCSDSDANAGTCPAASQVGTVEVGAGPGANPYFLPGQVYLTVPYKGGPYGLAVVVPAVAGPFNLGTVVVRQSLQIDPTTAQVTVVSDPFPTILDGIPLRIQRIDVNLNRPDFTVNPTSCDPMAVTGTLTSTNGTTASVSSRFQVGGCSSLGFSPKLKIGLSGKGKTRSGDHPTLTATLTDPSGQANIKTAKVTLPLLLALDPSNSNNVCPFATAQAVHGGSVGCPASTVVGTASVATPLLSQPLAGNVYLVQGIRTNAQGQQVKTLPSLLIPLRGQIALDLRAQTAVSGGKLVTTFSTIPDAPVSTFTLRINGGKRGLLVITGRGQSICQAKQVGDASLGAQSGKSTAQNMTVTTPCGKPARLTVLSRQVKGGTLTLRIRTSERGKVTATGKGLKSYSRTLGAGTHQIRIPIRRSSRAVEVQVHLQLTPANARSAAKTFTARM